MDSRMVFVLLWMLLLSTSTGIKLDGNGYVDVVIAISSNVPQDNRLIDKIKVNMGRCTSIMHWMKRSISKKLQY
uniref:Calcium-activated chloride channel N-terminal domain-containing protein n=1 Tax=Cyprinus carpio TaxID=7962 RepID=A0A8C1YAB4_CYPCA